MRIGCLGTVVGNDDGGGAKLEAGAWTLATDFGFSFFANGGGIGIISPSSPISPSSISWYHHTRMCSLPSPAGSLGLCHAARAIWAVLNSMRVLPVLASSSIRGLDLADFDPLALSSPAAHCITNSRVRNFLGRSVIMRVREGSAGGDKDFSKATYRAPLFSEPGGGMPIGPLLEGRGRVSRGARVRDGKGEGGRGGR